MTHGAWLFQLTVNPMLLVKISCGSPQASTAAIEQDARVKVATEKIEKGGKANYRHLCIETHLYTKTPDLQTTNKQGKVLRICGVTILYNPII